MVNYIVTMGAENITPLTNVKSIQFSRNLFPGDDSFSLTLGGIVALDPNSNILDVARQIRIQRTDTQSNSKTMFAGMITDIKYSVDSSEGLLTILSGTGLWHLLEVRLLKIDGFTPPGYPTNPYIMQLNKLLNFNFGMLFSLILKFGFTNNYGTGVLPSVLPAPTDFDGSFTQLNGSVAAGATQITVLNGSGFPSPAAGQLGNVIFIGQGDVSKPSSLIGETAVITGVVGNTITLYAPLQQAHNSGAYVYDYVVNDIMFLQYFSVAAAIQRLVQQALPQIVAEYYLDFLPSNPTLAVKKFDPVNGYFGVGTDKRNSITFTEGANLKNVTFEKNYEDMVNSMVITGTQFRGAEIIAAPIDKIPSISNFGLKQVQKSLGAVVDTDEIQRYVNNILPLIAVPIPYINAELVSTYPESIIIQPGDVININSTSLAGIKIFNLSSGTYASLGQQWSARIKQINRSWDVSGAERVTASFQYPLASASQVSFGYAGSTWTTILGSIQQQLTSATFNKETLPVENIVVSSNFTIADIVYANGSFIQNTFNQPLNVSSLVMSQQSNSNNQAALIYGLWLTVTAQNSAAKTVYVQIKAPDGRNLFNSTITVGTKINLLNILVPYNNNQGVLLSQLSGVYMFTFANSSTIAPTNKPDNELYSTTLEITYVKNPSSVATVTTGGVTVS